MEYIKKFLLISYIQHKGIKRICLVLGALFSFLPLCVFFVRNEIGILVISLLLFYLPSFIAMILQWIYLGFKDVTIIDAQHYRDIKMAVNVVSNPFLEADLKFSADGEIYHCYMQKYDDNGDIIACFALFDEDKIFNEAFSINTTKKEYEYHNVVSLFIPDTVYIEGKKLEIPKDKNKAKKKVNRKSS